MKNSHLCPRVSCRFLLQEMMSRLEETKANVGYNSEPPGMPWDSASLKLAF